MPSALNIPTQQRLSTRYFDIYIVLLFGDYICNEKDFKTVRFHCLIKYINWEVVSIAIIILNIFIIDCFLHFDFDVFKSIQYRDDINK